MNSVLLLASLSPLRGVSNQKFDSFMENIEKAKEGWLDSWWLC
jgi:hypothetical protein